MLHSAIFLSCSSSKSSVTYSNTPRAVQSSSAITVADTKETERRLIFSAYLSLTVENPDTASHQIIKIASKYSGYVSETGTYRTTIRVQSQHLEQAVEDISLLGRVDDKNLSGMDVTDDYHDFQIRLENAKKSRDRYLELLAKAENVEAALKVEKELERLNETIDLLKGRLNRIEHLTEHSTITVNLKMRTKPGVLGYVGIGIYRSIRWLFVRN